MKLPFKEQLKDKNVLYIVFFLAIINVFGYLLSGNFKAIVIFSLSGFISSYFSRNMIIIMLIAMVVTNATTGSKYVIEKMNNMKEGMKNKEGMKDKNESDDDDEKQGMATLSPATLEQEKSSSKKANLDYAGTLESAYDNLDKLLSSDALKNMSDDTQRLAEKQKVLMGNFKKLEPMMQKASAMLDGLDMKGMQGMVQSLTENMGLFKD